jgi:hypothetical protein
MSVDTEIMQIDLYENVVRDFPALELFPGAVLMSIALQAIDLLQSGMSDLEAADYFLTPEGRTSIAGLAYAIIAARVRTARFVNK